MLLDRTCMEKLDVGRTHLLHNGVLFEHGLSDEETNYLEERYSFVFPPDLRYFLQTSLPIGEGFPNWRGWSDKALRENLEWPRDGICLDVRNKSFWWPQWGPRPDSDDDAVALAINNIEKVPKLIPICGHSYLPSEPSVAGNPVFSVYQADVIQRGGNLAEYLLWIFHDENDDEIEEQYPVFSTKYRWIVFWSSLAKQNAQ